MKITRIFLVFLILVSLLLAGCTDRKAKSSNPSADLPKPTITTGTPESSQPGSEEPSSPETDSPPPGTSDTAASATTDRIDSAEDLNGQTATTEAITGTDPVQPDSTNDPGGIPVEEDATIIASGDVEFIGGD